MKVKNIPKNLNELIQPIKLFHNIPQEVNVDPINLTIQSVYKLCPKCKLILGANNINQLRKKLKKQVNQII